MEPTDKEYTKAEATLMRVPLSDFADARTEMVRTLRQHEKPELARRIAALRKPSVVLWALNQASDVAGDDLEQLRSASDRLREAQERLLKGDRSAGQRMAEAIHEQRRATDVLSRRLGMTLTAAGHAASAETLRRTRMTCETRPLPTLRSGWRYGRGGCCRSRNR